MKHSTLITALFCLLFGSYVGGAEYQLLTEEWAPYNYRDNGRITGLSTEVVQAIMALTGDDIPIRLNPSMRSTHELHTQPGSIMFSVFRTSEREPLYKWVGPIADGSIHPYQLATAVPINTLEQLLQAPRITTRHAGLIPTMLQSMGFRNLDMSATQSQQLYQMLLAGRTGVIIGDTDLGVAYHSKRLGVAPGTLRRIPIELYRSSLYIAFRPDIDDEFIAKWARALEHLRETGELQRIQQRYR